MLPLNAKQRALLRAQAHSLNPVVQVGHAGVTPAVLHQVNEALTAHELIKVKLGKECPITLGEAAATISSESKSNLVQQIGRVMVVFRRNPEQPKVALKVKAEAEKAPGPRGGSASKSGPQLERNRKQKKRRSANARRSKARAGTAGTRRGRPTRRG